MQPWPKAYFAVLTSISRQQICFAPVSRMYFSLNREYEQKHIQF